LNSAWAELAPRDGKILFYGTGLACTTYLHYLETLLNLWYLGCAVIRYKDENGQSRLVIAEDLGVITEAVAELVKYSGFAGIRV
jgi:aminoglycoside N3'-acetyltransferase